MESKSIGLKTYLVAWITFFVGTLGSTFGILALFGFCCGAAMANQPTEQVMGVAKTIGIVAVLPVLGVCSFLWFCATSYFMIAKKLT